jgi:hypothetical protein
MEHLYYVESEHETAETSDRLEAARIAAEWTKRGYKVDTIVVDEASGREEPPDGTSPPHSVQPSKGLEDIAPPRARRES